MTKVLEGHDVFVSVPTGYGKSLVYQLLPFCVEEILKRAGREVSLTPCVLVLSPLTALMSDQNSKMKTVTGANSVLLAKDQISISSMNCTHIFASPEALFHTDNGRRLRLTRFTSLLFIKNVTMNGSNGLHRPSPPSINQLFQVRGSLKWGSSLKQSLALSTAAGV